MSGLFLILALVIALVDQIIKYFVIHNLRPVHSVTAIPHILDFTYVENRGVAFGMFKDNRWIFIIFTSIVLLVFIFLLMKYGKTSKLFSVAAMLVIGGGIGNLVDRIVFGFVVDYLSLSFFPPVCNFADYCITAGTVLLVIYLLFYYDTDKKTKKIIKED